MDEFQERYLEHRENKLQREQKKQKYNEEEQKKFLKILKNRKSVRRFNDNDINVEDILKLALDNSPSSCNRKATYLLEVSPKEAEKLLVGGKNWIGKAKRVFLIMAFKEAYKSPREIGFMPYLDAGFLAQNIYLLCEAYGVGCCFVNPNANYKLNIEDYLCGAVALGDYDD